MGWDLEKKLVHMLPHHLELDAIFPREIKTYNEVMLGIRAEESDAVMKNLSYTELKVKKNILTLTRIDDADARSVLDFILSRNIVSPWKTSSLEKTHYALMNNKRLNRNSFEKNYPLDNFKDVFKREYGGKNCQMIGEDYLYYTPKTHVTREVLVKDWMKNGRKVSDDLLPSQTIKCATYLSRSFIDDFILTNDRNVMLKILEHDRRIKKDTTDLFVDVLWNNERSLEKSLKSFEKREEKRYWDLREAKWNEKGATKSDEMKLEMEGLLKAKREKIKEFEEQIEDNRSMMRMFLKSDKDSEKVENWLKSRDKEMVSDSLYKTLKRISGNVDIVSFGDDIRRLLRDNDKRLRITRKLKKLNHQWSELDDLDEMTPEQREEKQRVGDLIDDLEPKVRDHVDLHDLIGKESRFKFYALSLNAGMQLQEIANENQEKNWDTRNSLIQRESTNYFRGKLNRK